MDAWSRPEAIFYELRVANQARPCWRSQARFGRTKPRRIIESMIWFYPTSISAAFLRKTAGAARSPPSRPDRHRRDAQPPIGGGCDGREGRNRHPCYSLFGSMHSLFGE